LPLREPGTLGVGEQDPALAELLAQHVILGLQVRDDPTLAVIRSRCEGDQQEAKKVVHGSRSVPGQTAHRTRPMQSAKIGALIEPATLDPREVVRFPFASYWSVRVRIRPFE